MSDKETAKDNMLKAVPFFRNAIEDAKKNGNVRLAIVSYKPDGSGKIEISFGYEDFFNDIETLIDTPKPTIEDSIKAKATLLCKTFLKDCR